MASTPGCSSRSRPADPPGWSRSSCSRASRQSLLGCTAVAVPERLPNVPSRANEQRRARSALGRFMSRVASRTSASGRCPRALGRGRRLSREREGSCRLRRATRALDRRHQCLPRRRGTRIESRSGRGPVPTSRGRSDRALEPPQRGFPIGASTVVAMPPCRQGFLRSASGAREPPQSRKIRVRIWLRLEGVDRGVRLPELSLELVDLHLRCRPT